MATERLRADYSGGDYIWSWKSRVLSEGRSKAEFQQSQFYGNTFSAEQVRKHSPGFCPVANEEGEIALLVLQQMTGRTSVENIARGLVERFPQRFKDQIEALSYLGWLSEGYSR